MGYRAAFARRPLADYDHRFGFSPTPEHVVLLSSVVNAPVAGLFPRQPGVIVAGTFEQVSLPVLIINGTADRLASVEDARYWRDQLDGARLVEIEDGLYIFIY